MIRLIVATDSKSGIARGGQIPWDLPSDKARFRKLTLTHGANILMGRRTYDSMGDYLIGRHNYILSSKQIDIPKNCTLVNNLDEFLKTFNQDLWVIGGEQIYKSTVTYGNEIYLTKIEADFQCDQFFPEYTNYKLKDSDGPYSENGLTFYYQLLTRL